METVRGEAFCGARLSLPRKDGQQLRSVCLRRGMTLSGRRRRQLRESQSSSCEACKLRQRSRRVWLCAVLSTDSQETGPPKLVLSELQAELSQGTPALWTEADVVRWLCRLRAVVTHSEANHVTLARTLKLLMQFSRLSPLHQLATTAFLKKSSFSSRWVLRATRTFHAFLADRCASAQMPADSAALWWMLLAAFGVYSGSSSLFDVRVFVFVSSIVMRSAKGDAHSRQAECLTWLSLVNMLHGLASLRIYPSRGFQWAWERAALLGSGRLALRANAFSRASRHCTEECLAASFDAQAVANVAWAYATMYWRPSRALVLALTRSFLHTCGNAKAQELANIIWAVARLQESSKRPRRRGVGIVANAWLDAFEREAPRMSEQQLSITLWSFATLYADADVNTRARFLRICYSAFGERKAWNGSQALSNALWAVSQLEINRGALEFVTFLQRWYAHFEQVSPRFRGAELTSTIRALGSMQVTVPNSVMRKWCAAMKARLPEMDLAEVLSSVSAFAASRTLSECLNLSDSSSKHLILEALEQRFCALHAFSARIEDLAQFVWVCSQLRIAPSDAVLRHWFLCFSHVSRGDAQRLRSKPLVLALHALAHLSPAYVPAVFQSEWCAALMQSTERAGERYLLSVERLLCVTWSLHKLDMIAEPRLESRISEIAAKHVSKGRATRKELVVVLDWLTHVLRSRLREHQLASFEIVSLFIALCARYDELPAMAALQLWCCVGALRGAAVYDSMVAQIANWLSAGMASRDGPELALIIRMSVSISSKESARLYAAWCARVEEVLPIMGADELRAVLESIDALELTPRKEFISVARARFSQLLLCYSDDIVLKLSRVFQHYRMRRLRAQALPSRVHLDVKLGGSSLTPFS